MIVADNRKHGYCLRNSNSKIANTWSCDPWMEWFTCVKILVVNPVPTPFLSRLRQNLNMCLRNTSWQLNYLHYYSNLFTETMLDIQTINDYETLIICSAATGTLKGLLQLQMTKRQTNLALRLPWLDRGTTLICSTDSGEFLYPPWWWIWNFLGRSCLPYVDLV